MYSTINHHLQSHIPSYAARTCHTSQGTLGARVPQGFFRPAPVCHPFTMQTLLPKPLHLGLSYSTHYM
jgi:hypothetical protein